MSITRLGSRHLVSFLVALALVNGCAKSSHSEKTSDKVVPAVDKLM
jgi:hypothetical protein